MKRLGFLLLMTSCTAMPQAVYAQASLLAENIIDSVEIDVVQPNESTRKETFTLVRDARVPEQWYFFPKQPRLAEVVVNGQRSPEMSFIRYAINKPDGQVDYGGLLTFAVTLAMPPEGLESLKKRLIAELEARNASFNESQIRLAAVPINSATAAVYSPKTHALVAEGDANSILVPTDGNGKIVFALMLSQAGADVYNALIDTNGGLPVWIAYKFNGLTPPAGFRVTANWDMAYSHYSKDSKFRARASYYGWFGGSYSEDRTYIRNELEKSGAVKIDVIEGGNFDAARIDSYLQPIVKRLNDQLVEELKPPTEVAPAGASAPNASGYFGGVGYSVAIKDVKYRKSGTETWDFSYSSIIERAGAANGLISLAIFPKEVRDSVITNVDAGSWKQVYFAAPNVDSQVDTVNLGLSLQAGAENLATRQLRWTEKNGWVNAQGNAAVNGMWVSLLSRPDVDLAKLKWHANYQVAMGPYSTSATTVSPVAGESFGILPPSDLVRVIRVSADNAFADPNPPVSIDVSLSDGVRSATRTFSLSGAGESKTVTDPLVWPVPKERGAPPIAVSAKTRFNYVGRSCAVEFDAKQFADRFIADTVMLALIRPSNCK